MGGERRAGEPAVNGYVAERIEVCIARGKVSFGVSSHERGLKAARPEDYQ